MRRAGIVLSVLGLVGAAGLLTASGLARPGQRPGGTLRLSSILDVDSVDPGIAYFPQSTMLEFATCAKLYNYPDKPAPEGAIAIPEVAKAFPKVSKDGKTQTIELKRTYRFHTGARITAANFVAAFNRDPGPRLKSPIADIGYLKEIVGADAVMAARRRRSPASRPSARTRSRFARRSHCRTSCRASPCPSSVRSRSTRRLPRSTTLSVLAPTTSPPAFPTARSCSSATASTTVRGRRTSTASPTRSGGAGGLPASSRAKRTRLVRVPLGAWISGRHRQVRRQQAGRTILLQPDTCHRLFRVQPRPPGVQGPRSDPRQAGHQLGDRPPRARSRLGLPGREADRPDPAPRDRSRREHLSPRRRHRAEPRQSAGTTRQSRVQAEDARPLHGDFPRVLLDLGPGLPV